MPVKTDKNSRLSEVSHLQVSFKTSPKSTLRDVLHCVGHTGSVASESHGNPEKYKTRNKGKEGSEIV